MNTEKGTAATGGNLPGPPPLSRKERRKAERLAEKARPRGKCPFPGCGTIFLIEKDKPNACPRHRELIADVLFILDHTTIPAPGDKLPESEMTGPTILVPKPGMSNQAIKEAAEAAKGKGVLKP